MQPITYSYKYGWRWVQKGLAEARFWKRIARRRHRNTVRSWLKKQDWDAAIEHRPVTDMDNS